MSKTLSVSNLSYEELVLLQEIMMDVWEFGISQLEERKVYDQEVFDSLYDKVMSS